MKKFVSLLLIIALLLGVAGCHNDPVDPTQAPTTNNPTNAPTDPTNTPTEEPTEEPTEALPDEMQVYWDAIASLAATENIVMDVTIDETLTLNIDTYDTTTTQQITYLGIGTEDLKASVTEDIKYANYESQILEIFNSGKAYATVYGCNFSSDMTAEEFASRYLPIVILDESLYASHTLEMVDGEYHYSFSDATALESWLDAPSNTLIMAYADATIDADGNVTSLSYYAEYSNMGGIATLDVTIDYDAPILTDIKAPSNASKYTHLDYLDGPRMLEHIFGWLTQAQTISFNNTERMASQAGSVVLQISNQIDSWGAGSDLLAKLDYSYQANDLFSEEGYSYKQVERFEKGKYTISVDDGKETTNRNITAQIVTDYILDTISASVYDCASFDNATCTDLGNLLLVEFTGNDDLVESLKEYLGETLLGDADLLDSYATAYRTETMEYYIGIDKNLGLPTSIGLHYAGYHTIDGVEYLLDYQFDQSIYMSSLTAYETVTKQSAPDTEPAETATPVFYHVTGPDGQEMWLLGTIHVGDDRTGYLPQRIYDAFDASDALAVECNIRTVEEQLEIDEELLEILSNCYYYNDGTTTADHIDDKELYESALKLLKASGSYHYNAPYMTIPLWTDCINGHMMHQIYTLSSDKGVDNRLLMMAEAEGKKILEVESYAFQMQMSTGWSEPLALQLLYEAVSSGNVDYMEGLNEMYEMWCAGDEDAIREYLKDDTSGMTDEELALYEEYNTAMQTDRNKDMIQTAIEYLESGDVVFYAVGLAHVLGEDGLVDGLREAGYTVELVTYE